MRYGLKIRGKNPLQPVWTGSHMASLATPTAVRVIGVIPWIHHTRVKKAAMSCNEDTWKAVRTPKTSSRSGFKDNSPKASSHSGSWPVNAWQKLEDLAIKIPMKFHCQPWPLSLISIIVVLFITGPTRLPGWGGFAEKERARPTDSWKEGSLPLLEWRMLFLYKSIKNNQGHGPRAKGMNH